MGRFKVKSRVMMDLDHPGIVRVHHAGQDGGCYFLTMDYVAADADGPCSLEELIAARGGKFPAREVREAALAVCDALAYAHAHEVVHRDLKPANVLVDKDGRLRVTDFGLAKVLGETYPLKSVIERSISLSIGGQVSLGDRVTDGRPRYEKTSTRSILGTYDYMSPEQKAGGEVTPRSDLYSLGVMLYRMLTGRKPEGRFKLPSGSSGVPGCGTASCPAASSPIPPTASPPPWRWRPPLAERRGVAARAAPGLSPPRPCWPWAPQPDPGFHATKRRPAPFRPRRMLHRLRHPLRSRPGPPPPSNAEAPAPTVPDAQAPLAVRLELDPPGTQFERLRSRWRRADHGRERCLRRGRAGPCAGPLRVGSAEGRLRVLAPGDPRHRIEPGLPLGTLAFCGVGSP